MSSVRLGRNSHETKKQFDARRRIRAVTIGANFIRKHFIYGRAPDRNFYVSELW